MKLRRLLDPELGLANGDKDTDMPCLHQILAAIERGAEQVQPAPIAVAIAGGTDPLIALWAEHSRTKAQRDAIPVPDGADDKAEALGDELTRIEDQMESMVPISVAGALAQLRLMRFYRDEDECITRIVDNLIAGLGQLGEAAAGGLDALLLSWLALRESCQGQSGDEEGDEEVARIVGEMRAVERAILAGGPATESDWRAVVAMVVIRAREDHCYVNVDVIEHLYERLVIDRMTDPAGRSRERVYCAGAWRKRKPTLPSVATRSQGDARLRRADDRPRGPGRRVSPQLARPAVG